MRMHLKSKKVKIKNKHKFINKLLLIFMFILILVIILLRYINKTIEPYLIEASSIEAEKLSHIIIDYSIEEELKKNNYENILFKTNNDNNLKTIDLDTVAINKLLLSSISSISNNLRKIEKGEVDEFYQNDNILVNYNKDNIQKGIIAHITSGALFNNSMLANIGPKIPIRISLMGDITGKINTRVTNYGINNAILEVSLEIDIMEMVVLPITSHKISIKHEYTLATKLIQGEIPSYYFDNKNLPNVSLPIE